MTQVLQSPPAADGFAIERLWFAAGDYRHPASGSLDIRVVQRGSSYAEIDLGAGLRRVFTRPGDVLVTLPDRPTRFKITEDREVTLIAIGAALAAGSLSALEGSLSDFLPLSRPPIRSPTVAALCRIIEKPAPPALVRSTVDVILGLLLLQARKNDAARSPVLSQSRLDSIVATIDADLEHGWQVEELAAAAGMNRRAFTTAFKEATGLPAYQFVVQRRTAAAVRLLESTDLPPAQIAARTGFTHQAHLSRVLRRLTGKTPGQIRRR